MHLHMAEETATRRRPLCMDGPQHSNAIGKRIEVADAEVALVLEARHFSHPEPSPSDPHVDQGLHFKTITPQHGAFIDTFDFCRLEIDHGKAFAAEGVVPVAEVRVADPVDSIDRQVQTAVTRSPEMADIAASTSGHESRTLGKIGAFL